MHKIEQALSSLIDIDNFKYQMMRKQAFPLYRMMHPNYRIEEDKEILLYAPYSFGVQLVNNSYQVLQEFCVDQEPIGDIDEFIFKSQILLGDECTTFIAHKLFQKIMIDNNIILPTCIKVDNINYHQVLKDIIQNG